MSSAYMCDICGDCVSNADDAESKRTIASESVTISAVVTQIDLIIKTDKAHVCNSCWGKVIKKVKAWIDAHT